MEGHHSQDYLTPEQKEVQNLKNSYLEECANCEDFPTQGKPWWCSECCVWKALAEVFKMEEKFRNR